MLCGPTIKKKPTHTREFMSHFPHTEKEYDTSGRAPFIYSDGWFIMEWTDITDTFAATYIVFYLGV